LRGAPRSAGFQTGWAQDVERSADLEIGDTAGLETCATGRTPKKLTIMTANIVESSASDDAAKTAKASKRIAPAVTRVLMGLGFFVFGLNGFLNFIPPPKTMPEGAAAFMAWMVKSGYMAPLLFGTQTLVGALLLVNRFVPLALALIAPVIVNIVAFHIFIDRSGLPVAFVFLALELYLAWSYRRVFLPMLAARA
jgi:hypothetical protein